MVCNNSYNYCFCEQKILIIPCHLVPQSTISGGAPAAAHSEARRRWTLAKWGETLVSGHIIVANTAITWADPAVYINHKYGRVNRCLYWFAVQIEQIFSVLVWMVIVPFLAIFLETWQVYF